MPCEGFEHTPRQTLNLHMPEDIYSHVLSFITLIASVISLKKESRKVKYCIQNFIQQNSLNVNVCIRNQIQANTQRRNKIVTMSLQRRCNHVVCLLG